MNNIEHYFKFTDSMYLNALIDFAIFFVAAFIANFILVHVLKRLARRSKTDFDDKILDAIHKPVYLTIIITGVIISLNEFNLPLKIDYYIKNIIYTLIVLIWFVAFLKISRAIIENAVNKLFDATGLRKDILPLLRNISAIIVFTGALMAILTIWSVNISPILASAGIASVAIALAAKDTLANFFGGISIFFDKPYKVGDYIDLDNKDRGEVVEIGVRSTRIKTRDDILISIPNSIIANTKIVNESAPNHIIRLRIPIGVAFGSDIDLVESVLIDCAKECELIADDPEPRVRFRSFGESSLHFELLCWTHEPSKRGLTVHYLNKAIYKKFKENNISIPFPQRDLHLYGDKRNI